VAPRAPESSGAASTFSKPTTTAPTFKIPEDYEFSRDKVRQVKPEILRKYGIRFNVSKDMLSPIRDKAGNLTGGQQCKGLRIDKKKQILALGNTTQGGLFGQHLFSSGGKRLVITEGYLDACSAYQILGSRYPTVSVLNGTGSAVKDIKNNIDYIETFGEVIFCFDNDKVGIEKAKECASILTPGKAKIVPLTQYNDANEFLMQGENKAFTSCFWEAKRHQPDGIINLADIFDQVMKEDEKESIPYPWKGLNNMLDGIRGAELVTITSGSGMGKSSIIRELEYHLLTTTPDVVGILALEETPVRTTQGIMGIHCNTQLHRKKYRDLVDPKIYKEAFQATAGTGRLVAYDHFGSTSCDNLLSQIRYMIKALNCKHVVLDHLSIVVSAQEDGGDERKNIDAIMTQLRQLVQETGVSMFLVSHLRRVGGDKGHEDGAEVSLSHLRGSQSIAQLSDAVIALERNQQADSDKESNLTRIRVIKSRYTGQTGIATHLWYDPETGRLVEIGDESEVAIWLADTPGEFDF
jgi:twinkle protein